MSDSELRMRILESGLAMRAAEAPGGVAAGFDRWIDQPNGERIARMRLSDGARFGWADVVIPAAERMPRPTAVEFALEEMAAGAAGDPLLALEEQSPMTWDKTTVVPSR